jgi:hypothetical protein
MSGIYKLISMGSVEDIGISSCGIRRRRANVPATYETVFEPWNRDSWFINDWKRPVSIRNNFEEGRPVCFMTGDQITEVDYRNNKVYAEVILNQKDKIIIYMFKAEGKPDFGELRKNFLRTPFSRERLGLGRMMRILVTKDGFLTLKFLIHAIKDEGRADMLNWLLNKDMPPHITRERQVVSVTFILGGLSIFGLKAAGIATVSGPIVVGAVVLSYFSPNIYERLRESTQSEHSIRFDSPNPRHIKQD